MKLLSKPLWDNKVIFFLHLMLSTGHKDSVTCAMFSHDSSLVATADMSGLIKVWKVESKEEIWSFEVGDLEVRKCVSACASGAKHIFRISLNQLNCRGNYREVICTSLWQLLLLKCGFVWPASSTVVRVASLRTGAAGGNRRRQRVDVEDPIRRM